MKFEKVGMKKCLKSLVLPEHIIWCISFVFAHHRPALDFFRLAVHTIYDERLECLKNLEPSSANRYCTIFILNSLLRTSKEIYSQIEVSPYNRIATVYIGGARTFTFWLSKKLNWPGIDAGFFLFPSSRLDMS